MAAHVLHCYAQIDEARAELRRRGLSFVGGALPRMLRRARVLRSIEVGDVVKSWDVLRTATFLEEHVPRDGAILDLGAYASEILCVLRELGYHDLAGVDLNPAVARMPHADHIRYEVADFMHTPFAPASFDAVTAISVIEHGYRPARLLAEVSRLLRPGGYFVASFDYWPEKLDTAGVRLFGMDWCIFSRQDVLALVGAAAGFGLRLVGSLGGARALDAASPVIDWGGRRYSFAWLALRKEGGAVAHAG